MARFASGNRRRWLAFPAVLVLGGAASLGAGDKVPLSIFLIDDVKTQSSR